MEVLVIVYFHARASLPTTCVHILWASVFRHLLLAWLFLFLSSPIVTVTHWVWLWCSRLKMVVSHSFELMFYIRRLPLKRWFWSCLAGLVVPFLSWLVARGARRLLNFECDCCSCFVLAFTMPGGFLAFCLCLKLPHFAFVRAFVFILVCALVGVAATTTLLYRVCLALIYESLDFWWASDICIGPEILNKLLAG